MLTQTGTYQIYMQDNVTAARFVEAEEEFIKELSQRSGNKKKIEKKKVQTTRPELLSSDRKRRRD